MPLVTWRQRAIFAVSAGLLAIAAAEATARVEDLLRNDVPLLAVPEHNRDLLWQEPGLIRGKPGGHFKQWQLNSYGFRGPEMTLAPRPGCTRVVMLGASETFGLYESPGHEYPAALQRHLTEAGCFEVVNAAVTGLSARSITALWTRWVARFAPSIVVVYPTPAFYLANLPPGDPVPQAIPDDPWWTPRLLDRARDLINVPEALQRRRVDRWLEDARRGKPADWRFQSVPKDRLQLFTADVESLLASISATGATPIVVTHANGFGATPASDDERDALQALVQRAPRASEAVVLGFEAECARSLLAMAHEHGWTAVDAARTMGSRKEWFAEDFIHFNDAGAEVLAQQIAGAILSLPRAVQ